MFSNARCYYFFFYYVLPHSYPATFIMNSFLGCLHMSITFPFMILIALSFFCIFLERFLRLSFATLIQVSTVSVLLCHNSNVDFICATVFLLLHCFSFSLFSFFSFSFLFFPPPFPYPFCIFSSQSSVNCPLLLMSAWLGKSPLQAWR